MASDKSHSSVINLKWKEIEALKVNWDNLELFDFCQQRKSKDHRIT